MNDAKVPAGIRALIALFCALVVLGLLLALIVVGSPIEARKHKQDDIRVSDLSSIAQGVRDQVAKGGNPKTLSDVVVAYRPQGITKDPAGRPYEFRRLDKSTFELCAVFETDSKDGRIESGVSSYSYGQDASQWPFAKHTAGRNCYKLPIKAPK